MVDCSFPQVVANEAKKETLDELYEDIHLVLRELKDITKANNLCKEREIKTEFNVCRRGIHRWLKELKSIAQATNLSKERDIETELYVCQKEINWWLTELQSLKELHNTSEAINYLKEKEIDTGVYELYDGDNRTLRGFQTSTNSIKTKEKVISEPFETPVDE